MYKKLQTKVSVIVLSVIVVLSVFGLIIASQAQATQNNNETKEAVNRDYNGLLGVFSNKESSLLRAGNITITSENQLLTLKDVYNVQCFTDAAWRKVVFNAVKNGQDNAIGTSIEDAINSFTGDIVAKNKAIADVRGIDLLRNANKIDLRHNEIKDLSYLGQNTGDLNYKEWFANKPGNIDDRDNGENVTWDFGGNPLEKLPENFGGRLVIKQAATTSYTYPDVDGQLQTYLRSDNKSISGTIHIGKSKINKSGVWDNVKVQSVGSLGVAPYMHLDITGFDHNKNDTANFSGLTKTGMAKFSVGIDQELKYWTEDELGTSTPGSQSFKYYLTQQFQVYDKITVRDNYMIPVKLVKTDTDNASTFIKDAQYELYNEDGTRYNNTTYSTNDKGEIELSLPIGKYYFKEVRAPKGYLIDLNKIEFTVVAPTSNVATKIDGGNESVVTTTPSKTETAIGNQRFVVAPIKDGTGKTITPGSLDITLTAGIGTTVTDVKVTYAKLDVGGVEKLNQVKTYTTLHDAQNDINTQINENNLLGEVIVEVNHGNQGSHTSQEIKTTDKKIDLISKKVVKEWKDNIGWAGQHSDITIRLLRNGIEIDDVVLTGGTQTSDSHEFKDLYKTDQYGKNYVYSVIEDYIAPAAGTTGGYSTSIETTSDGFKITNTWNAHDRVNISGKKKWEDANDVYGDRPDSLVLTLMQDTTEYASAIASSDNAWKFSFNNIPLYSSDKTHVYQYTIKEQTLSNYIDPGTIGINTTGYGNGQTIEFNFTNVLKSERNAGASLEGQKIWEDYNDVYKKRPLTLEVELLQNNKPTGVKQIISPNTDASKNWTYKFNNLAKYDNDGNEYVYSVREVGVPSRYTAAIRGNDIINTIDHTQNEVQLIGQKVWKDYNNAYNTRSESLEIILLQDGVEYRRTTINGESKIPWRYNFQSLPKDDTNGREYIYTVKEVTVPNGYISVVSSDSKEIVNTLNKEINDIVSIEIKKIWDDKNNDKKRPDAVGVSILGDDIEVKKVYLKTDNKWQAKVSQLPKYNDEGKEIKYSLKEDAVSKYELTKNIFEKGTVENTYIGVLTNTPTKNIKTNDDTYIVPFVSVMLLAGGIMLVLKYCYKKEK